MPYPIPCPVPGKPHKALLAEFQELLVGTWENKTFPGSDQGGADKPLSYNIMPLPSKNDQNGYILKNFKYTEKIRFNDCDADKTLAIGAGAPNRGGLVSQNIKVLFYEQQVKYAEGPGGPAPGKKADVVHVENGTWLFLPIYVQQDGPYPADDDKTPVSDALKQPSDITIAKQINVPHGNSVLALGSYETIAEKDAAGKYLVKSRISGAPVIPDADSPFPRPANPVKPPDSLKTNLNADAVYSTRKKTKANFQNPHPELTLHSNAPLQDAVGIIKPDYYLHWNVTTQPLPNGQGQVTNIPFEHRRAQVIEYYADYWILLKGHDYKHRYLAYTQTMVMELCIKDKTYKFPHVTCNTLTYVG